MNIQCQNNAYVGRTHLASGGTIDTTIIQAEIDNLTTYTNIKFDELWDVNPTNSSGIINIKNI